MKMFRTVAFAVFMTVVVVLSSAISADSGDQQCKIGVLAKRGIEVCQEKWKATAEYLTKEIPGYSFEIKPLNFNEVNIAVEKGEVDFILVNSSIYVELEFLYGATRIATLKNVYMDGMYTVFGGVIFHRADRNDIKSFDDLRGKSFMGVKENSFGGWQMIWREFKEYGIDPYRDFTSLSFGGTHDAVVNAVRNGWVDAGAIRTGQLEQMAKEGKIHLENFYVIPHNLTHKFACEYPFAHSTKTYPEWPFAKTWHTTDSLAEKVAIALIRMSPDNPAARAAGCAGWTIPHNYQPVHECLKYLRIGSYKDYGNITAKDVIQKYWPMIIGTVVLLSIIILALIYVFRFNRKLHETLIITQDEITRRKQAEKEKDKLTSQLHQVDRMASIGQLAAGVAHEINNPVGYICSNLNTMNKYLWKITKSIKELSASEENHNDLDELVTDFGDAIAESLEGADRVKKIVGDLKGFSRADDQKPELTDLNMGIESTINVIWNQLKYHCKVEKDFGELPGVSCYPGQINQVFMNLLLNAGQAITSDTGLIRIKTWLDEDNVYVSIKDNGCGIPESNIKRVFQPFFTTKDVGKGTGLGLNLSYNIIEKHNGHIKIKSEVGVGSEFIVSLPLEKSDQPSVQPIT